MAIPLELPYGTLESRSLLGRLAGTGGLLTADETFDRAYHISGEGEWLLRMTDEVRRAFLSLGHLEPMFSNGHLLVQLEQDSQDVGETIEQVIRLAELLSDDRSDIELAAQAIAHSEDEAFVERLLRWTFEAGLQGQVLADAAQARLDHFLHRADDTPSLDARLLVRYFAERPMGELVALLTLNSRYPLDARLLAVEAVKRRGLRGEPASEDLLVPFRKLIGADQANEVLLAIMRALREMGKPVPYSVLSMAFEHARGTFGVGVVQEVLRRERDDCELVLCRLAGADDVAVSLAAVEALTGIGTETCVSVLLQLKEEVGTGVFAHDGLVNALETALIVVRSRLVGREAGRLSVYDDADPGALSITDPNEG